MDSVDSSFSDNSSSLVGNGPVVGDSWKRTTRRGIASNYVNQGMNKGVKADPNLSNRCIAVLTANVKLSRQPKSLPEKWTLGTFINSNANEIIPPGSE